MVVGLSTEPAELTPADVGPSVTAVATPAAATDTAPVKSSSKTTPPQVNSAWMLLQGTRDGVDAVAWQKKRRKTNPANNATECRDVAAQRLRDVQASGFEDVSNLEKLCQLLHTGASYKIQPIS